MSSPDVVSELVRKLGGPTVVAKELGYGLTLTNVAAWSRLGRVPHKWRWLVRQMAKRNRVELSADDWAALQLVPDASEIEVEAS